MKKIRPHSRTQRGEWAMARCRLAFVLATLGAVLALSEEVRPQPREEPLTTEIKMLRDHNVNTDGPALLKFFALRSLKDADRQRMEELVAQLDSNSFRQRQE